MNKKIIIIISVIIVAILAIIISFLFNPKKNEDKPVTKVETNNTSPASSAPQQATNSNGSSSSQPANEETATPVAPQPTTSDFTVQIQKLTAYYTDKSTGQPNFTVTNVKQPLEGWFITYVTPNDPNQQPVMYVFQKVNGSLKRIAGPGTAFPPQYITLPDQVRAAL